MDPFKVKKKSTLTERYVGKHNYTGWNAVLDACATNPLIVTVTIARYQVKRILVDGGKVSYSIFDLVQT